MVQLPKLSGSSAALRPCACGGCGGFTKSTWTSGHDGHCEGWAVRVLRGVLTLDQVPAEVRAGVALRLKRHGQAVEVKPVRVRKPRVAAAKVQVESAA